MSLEITLCLLHQLHQVGIRLHRLELRELALRNAPSPRREWGFDGGDSCINILAAGGLMAMDGQDVSSRLE